MNKRLLQLGALAALGFSATAFAFGGWAVVTVDDVPSSLIVGQPTTIGFAVRQHGQKLLNGLSPTLVAVEEKGGSTEVPAMPNGEGHYVAQLTVPKSGHWSVTINTSFLSNRVKLLPIPAIAATDRVKHIDAPPELGKRLFVAKGCIGCHVHGAVAGYPEMRVGPNLTPKRYQAEYLAKLLVDPSIARTNLQVPPMPKLELKPTEIAALIAFINADQQLTEARK